MGDRIWTVTADFERCEGHGLCIAEAARHLDMDDDVVVIIDDAVAGDDMPALQAAVRACPVAALRMEQRSAS
jgi:ferredoxin